jgi:hypothetical protein
MDMNVEDSAQFQGIRLVRLRNATKEPCQEKPIALPRFEITVTVFNGITMIIRIYF